MPPIVYSAWLGLVYVKGRKSRFGAGQTCLGPTPNPLHFFAQASTSQGNSKEGTGFWMCDLPLRAGWWGVPEPVAVCVVLE